MRAALALLGLLAALLGGGRASAHAQLVAADPPAGSVVAEAPDAVLLTFSEPVRPLAIRWFPATGDPVEAQPETRGQHIGVPLPAGLGTGTLLLSWRVVSADGHPVGGSHVFSVGAPSKAPPAAAPSGAARAAAIGRAALTVSLVFAAGGAVFLRLVAPTPLPKARRIALLSAGAVAPLALLASGLHGLDLLGLPPGALPTLAPWAAAAASPFAATAAASVLTGLAALAALRIPGPAGTALAALAWAAAALSFALFGHAAGAPPRWLMAPAVALHAAAAIFWLGALPGLAERAAGPGRAALAATLHRFSAVALPLVALLLLTGAAIASVQLGRPSALLDTAYGRLLAAKLAAVALLLALAARNRLRLTPAIGRGLPGTAPRLRRTILAEIAVGLAVLALASGFRLTPPPRSLAAAAAYVHLHGPTVMADVTLLPGRAGANALEIGLSPTETAGIDPREVRIAFADPSRGVEPIRLAAERRGDLWRAGPAFLPHPGDWVVTLDVMLGDFDQETLEATIPIAP